MIFSPCASAPGAASRPALLACMLMGAINPGSGMALTDLVAGTTQTGILTMSSVKPYIQGGKLRMLALPRRSARRPHARSDDHRRSRRGRL